MLTEVGVVKDFLIKDKSYVLQNNMVHEMDNVDDWYSDHHVIVTFFGEFKVMRK